VQIFRSGTKSSGVPGRSAIGVVGFVAEGGQAKSKAIAIASGCSDAITSNDEEAKTELGGMPVDVQPHLALWQGKIRAKGEECPTKMNVGALWLRNADGLEADKAWVIKIF